MKMPSTIIMEPAAFLVLTFSCRSRTLARVEKRGVTEEMGTARDCRVSMKLYVSRNHPRPKAMIPPATRVATTFLGIFRKSFFLSMRGAETAKTRAIVRILTVFMAKASSIKFMQWNMQTASATFSQQSSPCLISERNFSSVSFST